MPVEVASLFGTINLQDNLSGALDGVKSNLQSFASTAGGALSGISFASIAASLDEMGTKAITLGNNISNAMQPITNFATSGVSAAMDFQDAMVEISARTGLVGDSLDRVKALALQLGADTKFSSMDAAQGLLQLLSAGMSVDDAMKALPSVLNLAAAGNLDLGTAAKSTAQALAEFQLPASDAGRVAETLAKGAAASTAEVSDLSAGLANVGPLASQFGLSIEDTTAILATFANNGISGAEAGTQLKSMLTHLTSGTDATTQALKDLGVSLTDANGNYRPLNDIVHDLATSMTEQHTVTTKINTLTGEQAAQLKIAENAYKSASDSLFKYQNGLAGTNLSQDDLNKKIGELTTVQANAKQVIDDINATQANNATVTSTVTRTQEQNFQAVKDLAGSYGQLGLNVLINNDGFNTTKTAMEGQASASDIAQVKMSTFSGALESLKGSFETLQITLFTGLMTTSLQGLATAATDVVNKITDWAAKNPELSTQLAGIIVFLAVLGPGLVIIGGILQLASLGFSAASGAVGLLRGALGLLFSPVTILIIAFAGLMAAIQAGYPGGFPKLLEDAGRSALMLAGIFIGALALAANWVRDLFEKLQTTVQQLAAIGLGLLLLAVQFVQTKFNELGETVKSVAKWFSDTLTKAIDDVRLYVVEPTRQKFDEFIEILKKIWSDVSGAFDSFRDGVDKVFSAAVGFIQPVVDVINSIGGAIDNAISALGRLGDAVSASGLGDIGGVGGVVANAVSGHTGASGSTTSSGFAGAKASAAGGQLMGGDYSWVGEQGPELLYMPKGQSGSIVPNHESTRGGGGGMTINGMTIHANDAAGGRAAANAFERRLKELNASRGY